MKHKACEFAEFRLYIGSIYGYKGSSFSEAQLTRVVQDFQNAWNKTNGWTVALRITKTNFVCMDYAESGWEIAAINYPRFPKKPEDIKYFMQEIQEHLMLEFGQNRMTLLTCLGNGTITMSEKENAETTHR